jgi:hypothetical protein
VVVKVVAVTALNRTEAEKTRQESAIEHVKETGYSGVFTIELEGRPSVKMY